LKRVRHREHLQAVSKSASRVRELLLDGHRPLYGFCPLSRHLEERGHGGQEQLAVVDFPSLFLRHGQGT